MASSAFMKLACTIFVCVVLAAPYAEAAVTCGIVASDVGGCLTYLKSKGGAVPPACCAGVKKLNAAAATTADRQTACKCLKSYASVPGINLAMAAGLPGKCGVNVPYKISPSTDCSTVR